MKKILIIGIICAISTRTLNAADNCCTTCIAAVGQTLYFDSSCTDSSVCNCSGTTQTQMSNGVVQITTKQLSKSCTTNSDGSKTASAQCNRTISYTCAQGYYGIPAALNPTCTKCPSSGGIEGTTAGTGATKITECYIPSGSTFVDSTGLGTYTTNCYYSE